MIIVLYHMLYQNILMLQHNYQNYNISLHTFNIINHYIYVNHSQPIQMNDMLFFMLIHFN